MTGAPETPSAGTEGPGPADTPGLFERPAELAFWGAFVLGVPLLGMLVLDRYPGVGGATLPWYVGLGAAVLTLGVGVAARRRLVPWGEDSAGLLWITLVSVAMYAGVGAALAFVGLNGALDASAPRAVVFEVEAMSRRGTDVRLAGPDSIGSVTLEVTPEEYGRTRPGDEVVLRIRTGRFGVPWIEGYRLGGE